MLTREHAQRLWTLYFLLWFEAPRGSARETLAYRHMSWLDDRYGLHRTPHPLARDTLPSARELWAARRRAKAAPAR